MHEMEMEDCKNLLPTRNILIRNATIRKIMCKSFPQTIIILGQQQKGGWKLGE